MTEEYCNICRTIMDQPGRPHTKNCGGDCLSCMADAGDPEAKEKIKNFSDIKSMSYEQMVALRRFAPSGHPYFISGSKENDYFNYRFTILKRDISPQENVRISKRIGWEEPNGV